MAVPALIFHLILIFLIGRPKELQNLGMSSGKSVADSVVWYLGEPVCRLLEAVKEIGQDCIWDK